MASISIVYVLTNPAMPGLVKIGRTSQEDVSTRLAQLFTTGVPFPFKLEFACKVTNPEEVEKALHKAFFPDRVNPKREFFEIEPSQAIAILKLLHTEDKTKEIQEQPLPSGVEQQDVLAAEKYENRRPSLNFKEMGIPLDSELIFSENPEISVIVSGDKKVRLGEEEMSLSAATRTLLGIEYNVAPAPHWTYKGKSLRDIYNETYPKLDTRNVLPTVEGRWTV